MAKAEVKTEVTSVTITLSHDEAVDLMTLLGWVGGNATVYDILIDLENQGMDYDNSAKRVVTYDGSDAPELRIVDR